MTSISERSVEDRILEAALEVLTHSGPTRLSMSAVAAAAGLSRPTLYSRFPSKEDLLEAFGRYEQRKYDHGIANAIEGLSGTKRLDAILRFIVQFQKNYSLHLITDIEPEHVLRQLARAQPIMVQRLEPYFEGPEGRIRASLVTRVALSHALLPDPDDELFLSELRSAAGIPMRKSR